MKNPFRKQSQQKTLTFREKRSLEVQIGTRKRRHMCPSCKGHKLRASVTREGYLTGAACDHCKGKGYTFHIPTIYSKHSMLDQPHNTKQGDNMKTLGTILPTKESFAISKKHYETTVRAKEISAIKNGLAEFKQSLHGTEVRYWETPSLYAVIGRDLVVKWFEVRDDGDYRTNSNQSDKH